MAATREGGLKAAKKNLAKNPNFYKEIGAKGGSAKTDKPKGFAAMTPEKRIEAGRKGGLVKGELYKRNEVFQEYVPPVVKAEEAPKRRFALWGR